MELGSFSRRGIGIGLLRKAAQQRARTGRPVPTSFARLRRQRRNRSSHGLAIHQTGVASCLKLARCRSIVIEGVVQLQSNAVVSISAVNSTFKFDKHISRGGPSKRTLSPADSKPRISTSPVAKLSDRPRARHSDRCSSVFIHAGCLSKASIIWIDFRLSVLK